MGIFDAAEPAGRDFRDAVGRTLADFMATQRSALAGIGAELDGLGDLARRFVDGGKRLRPAWCYWGYAAVAGQPEDPAALLRAAASLDLLHASALVHDDLIDSSDTRRGVPSAHRQFAATHHQSGWSGSSEAFGRAGAILLGDLLLVWSAELFATAGLAPDALARATPLLNAVRTEVTAGQYLDVFAQTQPVLDDTSWSHLLDEAHRVVEYKTARYTVQRPAQIGAALAGGSARLSSALTSYGSAIGRAFQFRDDLLGVFGDSQVTGKPAGDDLREGKRTVLIAHACARAERAAARRLVTLLGRPDLGLDEVDEARAIITASGARAAVEADITRDYEAALGALTDVEMHPDGRRALGSLAQLAVAREA